MSANNDEVSHRAPVFEPRIAALKSVFKDFGRRWKIADPVTSSAASFFLATGITAGAIAVYLAPWHIAMLIAASLLALLAFDLVSRQRATQDPATADELSYRSFVMSAIEGVFRTTHDGQYLFANPALARIYGYASPDHLKNELTNIANQLYVDPGRRTEFQTELRERGCVVDFQSQIRRRDGTVIWIAENSMPVFDKCGQFLFYEGTVEDITSRREAEETTRQAIAETREAVRAKNAFLAAISHELKTPLNAVIGFSELILSGGYGPLHVKYHEYVSDIHVSGMKLLDMVIDILDFARIDGKLVELDEKVLHVSDLVHESADIVRPDRSCSTLATHVAPGLPMLRGDYRCIRRALVHLLRNAVEFTPADTMIRVDAFLTQEGGIAISVMDSVIGMKRDGTGLSRRLDDKTLSLVNAFIKLHDGEIAIKTLPDEGTTIRVIFPPQRSVARAAA